MIKNSIIIVFGVVIVVLATLLISGVDRDVSVDEGSFIDDGQYYEGYIYFPESNTCVKQGSENSRDPYEFHTKGECELANGIDSSEGNDVPIGPQTHIVEVQLFRFSPIILNIKVGDTVEFRAVDEAGRWVASEPYPTHTGYPGTDIKKCGTSEEEGMFDSCGALAKGESIKVIFYEKGTWGYLDHLSRGTRGKIIVE